MKCPTCGGHRVLMSTERRAVCRVCDARWVESPALRKAMEAGHPCAAHLAPPAEALLR